MKLITAFLLFFCGGFMTSQDEEDRLLAIIRKESDQIASSLNLCPFGFGIQGPGGIKGITLSFKSYEGMGIDTARCLIVQLGEKLINQINLKIDFEKLEQGNLDLSFFYIMVSFPGINTLFNETEGELALITISRGIIKYEIRKSDVKDFIPVYSESFEEAYQKVFDVQK
jgi:hypothetical protein